MQTDRSCTVGAAVRLWLVPLILLATPATAATFTVTTTIDEVDAAPGDGICATATGECTLRAAVQELNVSPAPNSIELPAGLYRLTILGRDEDDAATGDLDIRNAPFHILGAGSATTIIDAGGIDRVVHLPIFTGESNTITGVTIRYGDAGASAGGGISKCDTSYLVLTDVTVSHNAAASGGGIANICCAVVVLVNSRVTDNFASDGGGGIYNLWWATLENTEVSGNVAEKGGGILSTFENLTITDSRIADNEAVDGGGVFASVGGVARSTLSGNRAHFFGGGLYCGLLTFTAQTAAVADEIEPGNCNLSASTVSDNIAGLDGGGVWAGFGVGLFDSTVSANRAGRDGGGMWKGGGGISGLSFATVTGNTADSDLDGIGDGGGIFDSNGLTTFAGSLVAGNTDTGTEAPDCYGTLDSQGYNLIGDATNCAITGDTTGNLVGLDPRLRPLQDNGGPTATHALLSDSPALDAGGSCSGTDQRGVSRPQFTACDIGAYESACGNGMVDLGEQCDDGNTANGDCCSSSCQYESNGSPCASDDQLCTVDVCNASGACTHPAGNAGTECRTAEGPCDVAESCDGVHVDCPADAKQPNGTSCNDGNACSVGDYCGAGACVGFTSCDVGTPCGQLCGATLKCKVQGFACRCG